MVYETNGAGGGASCVERADVAGLYQEHIHALCARCGHLLGSQEAGRDAAHDTFVRFLDRYVGVVTVEEAPGLLHRIAKNRCVDELRRGRHRSGRCVEEVEGWQAPEQVSVVMLGEVQERVEAEERALLVRRYVEEATLRELAAERGESITTVRRRLLTLAVRFALCVLVVVFGVLAFEAFGHGLQPPARHVMPARVVAPAPPHERAGMLERERRCLQGAVRECGRAARLLYNARRFTRAMKVAQVGCVADTLSNTEHLMVCQRAGLLARFHAGDELVAQEMFERGCQGDASRDSSLARALRAQTCAQALIQYSAQGR